VGVNSISKVLFLNISLDGLYPHFQVLDLLMDEVFKRTDLIKAAGESALERSKDLNAAFKPRKT